MKKIEGLKFLMHFFPQLTIDTSFVSCAEELIVLFERYMEADSESFWRIRCANFCGSELALPMGSFYSNESAVEFVNTISATYPEYTFIIHRVNNEYYYPDYCGTIVVQSFDDYEIIVDLQKVSQEMIDKMDIGIRPRDWTSTISLRRNAFRDNMEIIFCNEFVRTTDIPLKELNEIATKICWIYMRLGIKNVTYTRFNICKNGTIVLNDHRGKDSFVEENEKTKLVLQDVEINSMSLSDMNVELRKKIIVTNKESNPKESRHCVNSTPTLQGIGASKGVATGKALVVKESNMLNNLRMIDLYEGDTSKI